MASTACCEAGKPLAHEYTRQGDMTSIETSNGKMDVYMVGESASAVIVIPDIFGHAYNQVFQVCDRIASAGFIVACPDVFFGKPWSLDNFPPSDKGEFMAWINGPLAVDTIKGYVNTVMTYLKEKRSVKAFAVSGHCWGCAVSLSCAANSDIRAVSCSHPAFFGKEKEYAEAAQCPVCILPAKGDPMEDAKEILDKKPFGSKCVYQRFDDMEHGFMAARGDWKDPKIAEAAGKGLDILCSFLKWNVPVLLHEEVSPVS